MQTQSLRTLGVFSIVMITVGSVDSIRNLPATALFGPSLIFFFSMAALLFLLPSALVAAELSSLAREEGGIYSWVKHAFGAKAGLYAVWFQWIENVIFYPTILSFIASTCAYLLSPGLAHNRYFLVLIILLAFWGATLINCRGMEVSAWFANICAIMGLLIPMVLIISLGLLWWFSGRPMQINFSNPHVLIPSFTHTGNWVALTGIILSFCGVEIATVHSRNVKRPQRTYPLAMLISTVILFITLLLGSLAIAFVLPAAKISLVAGIMQAFDAFFVSYHLHWILPGVALMLIIGGLGGVNNWIIAPSRGLLLAAEDKQIPMALAATNKFLAPHVILISQAVVVSLLSLLFLFMPSINESYWMLNELAVQLYMLMYIMMFAAVVKLRFMRPKISTDNDPILDAGFRIPGGNWGVCVVAAVGAVTAIITIFIGFIPPPHTMFSSVTGYSFILLLGLILLSLPPVLLMLLRRVPWLAGYLR